MSNSADKPNQSLWPLPCGGDVLASDGQRIAVESVFSVMGRGDVAHSPGRMWRFDKTYSAGVCFRARKAGRRSAVNTSALVGSQWTNTEEP